MGTDFIIPYDLEYFKVMTSIAASGKESHVTFDVRVGSSGEKSEWFRITYDVIRDDENKPVSLLGLAQNINELKLEQRRLAFVLRFQRFQFLRRNNRLRNHSHRSSPRAPFR